MAKAVAADVKSVCLIKTCTHATPEAVFPSVALHLVSFSSIITRWHDCAPASNEKLRAETATGLRYITTIST